MPKRLEKTRFILIHQLMRTAKLTSGEVASGEILSKETMTNLNAGTRLSHDSLSRLADGLEHRRTRTEEAKRAFSDLGIDDAITARTLEYSVNEELKRCDTLVEALGDNVWRTSVNDVAKQVTGGTSAIEHVDFLMTASPQDRERFAKQIKSLKAKEFRESKACFDAIWPTFLRECNHPLETDDASNPRKYRLVQKPVSAPKGGAPPDLEEEDLQRVQQVRNHAKMILERDQGTLRAFADVIGRKELRLPEDLDDLYGPVRRDQNGSNHTSALSTFLGIVHRLTVTPTNTAVDTLLVLRDVAICLSLPVDMRKSVIGQVLSNDHIVSLPTNYTSQGKLYLGFAHGILPKGNSSVASRLEALQRIHEGEVDVSDQLRVVKTDNGQLLTTEEPPEGGANGKQFKTQLCQGLAKFLGYPVDLDDKSWPSKCIDRINTALDRLKIVGVRICVVLTEKRGPSDIADLRKHIPDLAFVSLLTGSCATHEDLQFEINLVTNTIHRRNN